MLHKYLRPRFAPGAPRRKHRREGGERLQSGRNGKGGGSSPVSIPRDPQEDPPTDRVCYWVPECKKDNQLLIWRTQATETRALAPSPLAAGRQRIPAFPGQRRPDLPRTYPCSRLCSPDPGQARPSLGARGRHCPAPAPAPRPQITLELSARSRPQRPGREPFATRHLPRQSGRASTLPYYTSPCPHYPTHKQPLPTRHHILAPSPSS